MIRKKAFFTLCLIIEFASDKVTNFLGFTSFPSVVASITLLFWCSSNLTFAYSTATIVSSSLFDNCFSRLPPKQFSSATRSSGRLNSFPNNSHAGENTVVAFVAALWLHCTLHNSSGHLSTSFSQRHLTCLSTGVLGSEGVQESQICGVYPYSCRALQTLLLLSEGLDPTSYLWAYLTGPYLPGIFFPAFFAQSFWCQIFERFCPAPWAKM